MSTTTNGSGPAASAPPRHVDRPMATAPPLPPPRTRRRPGLYALGTVLVVVGALAAVWLVNSTSSRVPVLALARDVSFGDRITRADLATTEVAHDPSVRTVPADQASEVVGTVATTTLLKGSLLSPGQFAAAAPPAAGQVLVPLAMAVSRLPAGGLQPGDKILVIDTPPADADVPDIAPASIAATVVRVGRADLNDVAVIDVTAASGDGPALAVRSATGRFALVLQRAGG
jgi:hypothetical protein